MRQLVYSFREELPAAFHSVAPAKGWVFIHVTCSNIAVTPRSKRQTENS